MTQTKRFSLSLITLCALCFGAMPAATAQSEGESHKSYQVAVSYLSWAMSQEWNKAAGVIELESLKNLKARWVDKIRNAPTVSEEIAICRRLDCLNLDEVAQLDPTDFYARYHKAFQDRFKVDDEALAKIVATIKVKFLSLAIDEHNGKTYSHVLVRTKHNNGTFEISSIEMISLVLVGDKWQVTLEANQPTRKKIGEESGEGAETTPKK